MAAPLPGPVQVVADDLPGAGRDQPGGVIGADLLPGRQRDTERAGDLQHMPGALVFEERPQLGVAAPYFASGLT